MGKQANINSNKQTNKTKQKQEHLSKFNQKNTNSFQIFFILEAQTNKQPNKQTNKDLNTFQSSNKQNTKTFQFAVPMLIKTSGRFEQLLNSHQLRFKKSSRSQVTYTSQRSSTTTEELSNPESGARFEIYDGSVFGWCDFCWMVGMRVFRGGKIEQFVFPFLSP